MEVSFKKVARYAHSIANSRSAKTSNKLDALSKLRISVTGITWGIKIFYIYLRKNAICLIFELSTAAAMKTKGETKMITFK